MAGLYYGEGVSPVLSAYGDQPGKIQSYENPPDADHAPRRQMGPHHRLAGRIMPSAVDRRCGAAIEPGRVGVIYYLLFFFFALVLIFRLAYRPVLWRLRNRLIVTYLFIGVIPILLLVLMGGVAGYLFAGQFATYIATSDLHSELLHLQAANDALAAQLFPLESTGKLNEQIAGELTRASDERFPGRTVTVSRSGRGFVLSTGGALLATPAAQVPDFINGDLTDYIVDQGTLHLRAIKLGGEGSRRIALISDIPITPNLIVPTAARLGIVNSVPPVPEDGKPHHPLQDSARL